MSRTLEEIVEDFDNIRQAFRHCSQHGDCDKNALIEFQGRFTDLKADLRPTHNEVTRNWTKHDDKSATAIKYRLAVAIHKGEHEDFEACSLTQAEKLAPASKEYKKFIEKRSFWRESLNNINDLRDDISSYCVEISNRLKNLY